MITDEKWREKLYPVHLGQWKNALQAIKDKLHRLPKSFRTRDGVRPPDGIIDALEAMLWEMYGQPCPYCVLLGKCSSNGDLNPNIIRAYPVYRRNVKKEQKQAPNPHFREPDPKYAIRSKEELICCEVDHKRSSEISTIENLTFCCRYCNNYKSNTDWDKWVKMCNTISSAEPIVRRKLIASLYHAPAWKKPYSKQYHPIYRKAGR